jgi:hypothetical protein
VKEWLKMAGITALIGLSGASIGLCAALWFGAPTYPTVVAIQQAMQSEGSHKSADSPKANDSDGITLIVAVLGAGTSIMTLFVVCYQTLIFRGQHKIMERQADIAERALVDVERPFIFAEVTHPGFEIRKSDPIMGYPALSLQRFELRLFNLGRTPASLTRLKYTVFAIPHGATPPFLDPRVVGGRELPVGTVATEGRPFTEGTNMFVFLKKETDREAVANDRSAPWLVGFVRYDDLLGGHYITGFSQVYDPLAQRFIQWEIEHTITSARKRLTKFLHLLGDRNGRVAMNRIDAMTGPAERFHSS